TGLPDNFNSGSVGVLQKQGEDWVLVDRLFPDTPRLEAFFGIALAISGDWALVGSYEESNGLDAGAAYFFHKENGVWVQKQRVVGSGVQAGDFFGSGLGISGKTAVVGSFLGEEAYVYEYEENQWVEKKKLVANDGQAARKFGSRAVVSGERILIAARSDNAEQGAVYVSEKVGDSWEIVDKITALDGQMGDNFGVSISLQGDRALIGAFKAERNGLQTGGAYLYEYQSGSWEQQEKWMLENGADGDEFGAFVHLQADIALVGANKRGSSGALFMFKEGEAEWKEYPEIVAANSVGGASFGLAAGISKDELLVGAFGEDSPEADNGAVYTFDISCTEDTTGCIMPTNLAWGKAARQSTTYGDGLASIAVDGIVDGQGSPWGTNASLQHTQSETSPWWEVDLGENSAVESVSIYNRTSCCQDRLRDLYVLISPEPFGDTTRLADLLSDPFISHAQLTGIPTDSIISIPISVSGRYVRIQLPDDGVNSALHVAEIEVYGCVEEVLTPCEKNFEALMEIYNQTGGINWRRQANWGVGCPCENNWEGVICGDSNTVTLLTLGGNNLVGEIPETLGDLIYLEELVLAGNPITQLPQSIGKLKSVHTFYLDQTLVTELPNSFGELSALTNLYLMGSILTELPASFGNLSSLRSLYIANSSLTSLPTTFGDLGALEFAEFNENQLQFLPESIGNLRELQTLRLFKNQIVLLPPSIGNLTQLKELDLGENLLTTLPQTVGNLNQLQHLSLIGNELEELPAAIGDLDVITNLFLDDNPTLVCLPSSMKVYCDRAVDIRTNGSPVDWQAFCEEGLHACEIDSSACATPSNLALNQSTNQSSTYGDGFASIAVDGDKDGSRGPWGATASIQHTLSESQPWWEVDLGVQAQIESVELTNRSDCCNERLANFYVLISEIPFTTSASLDELLADTSIYQFFFAGQAGIQQSISLETQGRYMRIQLTGSGILHMAEVEVRGCIKEPTNESQRFAQANDGLAGNPQDFALNAYPNPFSQTILLELGADWEANTHIRVYNSLGQKLYSQVTNDQQEYELGQDWPAGIYWIEVRSGEAMKTLQIQKN
ncbi:MAG: discoidin domain-containing protein, partial [Bacteroidota bacterium]